MKKKIYIIEAGMARFFTESKEEALKLWEILSEGNFKLLYDASYDCNTRYPYAQPLKPQMSVEEIDLFPSGTEAKRARENEEKLKKAKIIKP